MTTIHLQADDHLNSPSGPLSDGPALDESHYIAAVLAKGSIFPPILWSLVVLSLLIADIVRCRLVLSHKCCIGAKGVDIIWFGNTGMAVPPLVGLVVMQISTDDMLTVALLVVLMAFAAVCDLCATEISALNRVEMAPSNDKVCNEIAWTLHVLHNLTVFTVLLTGGAGFVVPIFDDPDTLKLDIKSLTMILFVLLLLTLGFTQSCTHFLCMKRRTVPSGRDSIKPEPLEDEIFQDSVVIFPGRWDAVEHMSASPYYETPSENDGTSGQQFELLDLAYSARVFNQLYGCHVYHEHNDAVTKTPPSVLKPVQHQTTVDSVDTMNQHGGDCCVNEPVIVDNVSTVAEIDRFEPIGRLNDNDDAGPRACRMDPVLVKWSWYYTLDILVNSLLVTTLIDMTGVIN
ncbi:hypothetical protein T484DRAFT_1756604 [Baffinella frigidus]|nr:hypothetical protein T484DRAFT_1756604 [Cryptophyta sp. CCMP2293]